jgi:membrane-bound lytic murein transglycosylase B
VQAWIKLSSAFVLVASLALDTARAENATPDFDVWLDGVRTEAADRGISDEIIATALTGIASIPRIIELDRAQPEFTLTFEQYLTRVVPDARVAKGRRMLDANRALLEEVGAAYGVQPRFIVALWGIETDFGRLTGGFSVVEALATLAYDGRRSEFFRKELFDALQILNEGHISPAAMTGSWAGAMGQSQFMPSSFLGFAQDYDGDGRRDIWTTKADVFASAANYLASYGWADDQAWGREVSVPAKFDPSLIGLEVRRFLAEWQALGLRRADGSDLPTRNMEGSIVLPDGEGGRAFLVYDNFRTILRWNRSTYFGVAVGHLADQIVWR